MGELPRIIKTLVELETLTKQISNMSRRLGEEGFGPCFEDCYIDGEGNLVVFTDAGHDWDSDIDTFTPEGVQL